MSIAMHEPHPFSSQTIVGRAGAAPRVLFTAGVHGDEYEPMSALRRLIQLLAARVDDVCGRITIVPVVNESAFRNGTRAAPEDGLDLARICPGKPDGTPTERVAFALSQLIRDSDYYIDLHTGGVALALVPLAGYMLHPVQSVLDAQRRMAVGFGLPLVWGTSASLPGRSLSVARDARVPAIYVEHGGGSFGERAIKVVAELIDGCLSVLHEIGCLHAWGQLPSGARPNGAHTSPMEIVEDGRDESGHLQVHHPAPADGAFEPAIGLGQHVRRGQPIGAVVDTLGSTQRIIEAEHAGTVLMLRAVSRVRTGDALAYILPDDAPRRDRARVALRSDRQVSPEINATL